MQENKKSKEIVVIGLVAALAMLISYVFALAQFEIGWQVEEETSAVSEDVVFSEPESSAEVSTTTKEYEYYDDFVFEAYPYQNKSVVDGSLAIIKDGSNGFPSIDQSRIVNIGEVRTNVYGLSNMSLVLYKEAIENIDKFIVSFYEQVPSNGLIINKGYTSGDKISPTETTIDLATGYSVQFSIFNSSYKFSDTEFSYLRDQAYRYGVIQRYPSGKEQYTSHDSDNTIYRYIGLAHTQYMNRYRYSLEEYIDKVKTEGIIEYKSELEDNVAYVIYYVPVDESVGTTYVDLPQNDNCSYSVSGDGGNGFIVSVKISL